MTTRADCIRAVVSAGATEEQAADIVNAIMEEKKRLRAEGRLTPETLAEAWQARAPEVERLTALKRRRAMLSAVRRNEALQDIRRAQAEGFGFLDGLKALLVGRSKRFTGARPSIAAQRRVIFASWADPLARELDAIGAGELGKGGVLRLLREDKTFHDAVIVAMREPDAAAEPLIRETADTIACYVADARRRFNLAGGDMGRLEGWTPQRHDAEKLLKAGPDAWQKAILPLLDMERTFGRDAADADKVRKILSGIHETLTIGRNPFLASGGREAAGRDMAAPLEQARVLHFRSGKDAVAYSDRFGAGNLFDATLQHLDRMARAVALMERLGPNPEQTVRRLIADERARVLADTTLDHATRRKTLRELDAAMTRGVAGGATAMQLAELTGEAGECVFPTLAGVSCILRATQTLSMLGGAALSATSDAFIKAASMRCNGETWPGAIVKSVLQYLDNYRDGPARRAAAGQAGAFLDALTGSMAAAWDTDGDMIGRIARARNWLFRWTGLNWITEQGKAGYGLWLSRHIGEAAAHDWDALQADVRAMLEWHGVDAARWDVLRSMTAVDEEGRRCFLPVDVPPDVAKLEPLLPERLRGAPPSEPEREAALARLRERVRTDALVMLADETDFAISEPDDAGRAITRQGLRRGTYAGEFWRLVSQFKSFPMAYIQRVMGGRRWVRGSRQSGMRYGFGAGVVKDVLSRDMPGVLGFAMLAVSFGYASMTLKDIAHGRKPRDPRDMETWLAACLQSGGLGIFGDFLFGELSRFGNSAAASAVESGAGMAEAMTEIPGPVLHGEPKQARDQFITAALDNTPFVNMWYTRAALNYTLLYHVKAWMSPGSLRRMARRMKKFGEFFLPPSSVIARGGGFR